MAKITQTAIIRDQIPVTLCCLYITFNNETKSSWSHGICNYGNQKLPEQRVTVSMAISSEPRVTVTMAIMTSRCFLNLYFVVVKNIFAFYIVENMVWS